MLSFPPLAIFLWALAVVIAYYFLAGFIWGAGFAPTSSGEIEKVAQLLDLESGDTFYDLGCGYGRMIFAMAKKHNVKSVGVEVDPVKIFWLRLMVKYKRFQGTVKIVESNFLEADLSGAENVFVFLSNATPIMTRLKEKMLRDMKPGSRIVSYTHRFKDWQPEKSEGKLFLYVIPGELKTLKGQANS